MVREAKLDLNLVSVSFTLSNIIMYLYYFMYSYITIPLNFILIITIFYPPLPLNEHD